MLRNQHVYSPRYVVSHLSKGIPQDYLHHINVDQQAPQ